MKSQAAQLAYALLAAGLVVLILVIIAAWPLIEFAVYDSYYSTEQMHAGKKYMDSLTDKDIQAWIQRAQTDLEKDNPTDFTGRDAPPDLQKLGMTGIEENSNYIDYMWLGGMNYTALDIQRTSNGDFQVTAVYTPYTNRVIWPRQE
ncbi:MAG TPA: hypothetical protein VMF08_03085 [Candidatus Sulfotelmatobacter sp.]|nr:hypothetical protein [Candidatus Sulfotelmatobacter sp.]